MSDFGPKYFMINFEAGPVIITIITEGSEGLSNLPEAIHAPEPGFKRRSV